MIFPERRFPFGHDPVPPREVAYTPDRTTDPLGSLAEARVTEPLPLQLDREEPSRETAPIIARPRRNTLPFQPAGSLHAPVLLPTRPRRRVPRRRRLVTVLACVCVALALLVMTLVRHRAAAPHPNVIDPWDGR